MFAPFSEAFGSASSKTDVYCPGLPLSHTEAAVYADLFKLADVSGSGVIAAKDAVPFLKTSNLPIATLNEIWRLVDPDGRGFLNQAAFFKTCKLIAAAQAGAKVSLSLLNTDTGLPKFDKNLSTKTILPQQTGSLQIQPTGSLIPQSTGTAGAAGGAAAMTITPEDRDKYLTAWKSCSPVDGTITGDVARDLFIKSGLPMETLGKIWMLVDTANTGKLTLNQFMISMHLIIRLKMGVLSGVPASIPPQLFNSVASLNATAEKVSSPLISQQIASPTPSFASAKVEEYAIPPEDRKQYELYFDGLDTAKSGLISGEQAYGFMTKSKLSEALLAQIWELADTSSSGNLNKQEFTIAMYFIKRAMSGLPIPPTLPPSLTSQTRRKSSSIKSEIGDLLLINDTFTNVPPPVISPSSTTINSMIAPPLQPNFSTTSSGLTFQPTSTNANSFDLLQSQVELKRQDLKSLEQEYSLLTPATEELKSRRVALDIELKEILDQKHELTIKMSTAKAVMEAERQFVGEREAILTRERQMVSIGTEEVLKASRYVDALKLQKEQLEKQSREISLEIEGLKNRIGEYNDVNIKLSEEIEKLKSEVDDLKGVKLTSERQLLQSQEMYQSLMIEKQKLQKLVESEKESIRQLSDKIVSLQSQKMNAEKEVFEATFSLESQRKVGEAKKSELETATLVSKSTPVMSFAVSPEASAAATWSPQQVSTFSPSMVMQSSASPQEKKKVDINSIIELSKQIAPSGPSVVGSPEPTAASSSNIPLTPKGSIKSPKIEGEEKKAETDEKRKSRTLDMTTTEFATEFPEVGDFETQFVGDVKKTPAGGGTVESNEKGVEKGADHNNSNSNSNVVVGESAAAAVPTTATMKKFDESVFENTSAFIKFDEDFSTTNTNNTNNNNNTVLLKGFEEAFGSSADPFSVTYPTTTAAATTGGTTTTATVADFDAAFGGPSVPAASVPVDFSFDTAFEELKVSEEKSKDEKEDAKVAKQEEEVEEVKQVMGMGFSREEAMVALEKCGYDLGKSVEYLLERKGE